MLPFARTLLALSLGMTLLQTPDLRRSTIDHEQWRRAGEHPRQQRLG